MESTKWYEKTWLLILACVIFFPVGLYGVYKSQKINKNLKYVIFGFFGVLILANAFRDKTNDVVNKSESNVAEEDSIAKIKELQRKVNEQPIDCYYVARRYLKDHLNDKDSYEEDNHKEYFIEPRSKKDPYIQVIIRYRAKNGFGAMILNETVFNFDESLNMVKTYNN